MERKVFKLMAPINSDKGDQLKELKAKLLTLGEHNKAVDSADDEFEQADGLVRVMTGLTEDELDRLSVPDYNALAAYLDKQRTLATSDFISKDLEDDAPELLQPVTANGGEEISVVRIKVPTIKALRARDKVQGGEMDRALWLTSHCTELGIDDLKGLCLPDWLQVQQRLGDFLLKPAGYFQSGTSAT